MNRAPAIGVTERLDTPVSEATVPAVPAPYAAAPFMMLVDTTLVAGPSSQNRTTDTQFRFLLNPYYGGYYFLVEWGDGSSNVVVCGKAVKPDVTDTRGMPAGASTVASLINLPSVTPDSPALLHTYALPGQYVVSLTPLSPTGLPGIAFNDYSGATSTTKNTDCLKVLEIQQWGSNPWAAMDGFMMGARNMTITAWDSSRAVTGGVANWDRAFCYCRALASFPGTLDFGGADNLTSCWNGCVGLTSFPATLDFSKVTTFVFTWTGCSGLTAFPLISIPSATTLRGAWQGNIGLTSFPLIDIGHVTNLSLAWDKCSGLTSFPLLDTGSCTNFSSTWSECTSLTEFPLLDTSKGTNFFRTWDGCSGLTAMPPLSFESMVSGDGTFWGCSNLVTHPDYTMPVGASLNLSNFFRSSGVSDDAYSNFLVRLEAANPLNTGSITQTPAKYTPAAAAARSALILRGWTIGDNGAA